MATPEEKRVLAFCQNQACHEGCEAWLVLTLRLSGTVGFRVYGYGVGFGGQGLFGEPWNSKACFNADGL